MMAPYVVSTSLFFDKVSRRISIINFVAQIMRYQFLFLILA